MTQTNDTEYFVKGVVINPDTNKREAVLVEAHQTLEWAEKASNRMYFDEGAKFTLVFEGTMVPLEERKKVQEQIKKARAEKRAEEEENADVPF